VQHKKQILIKNSNNKFNLEKNQKAIFLFH